MLCFEKFINIELNKYNLTFDDFLREVDDTQDKPKVFREHQDKILQCKNIKKLRVLLEKYYFSKIKPHFWIIRFFNFLKRFDESKFDNIEGKDDFWYNLSSKWEDLISIRLEEDPFTIIKPYCSKEENLIKTIKFKRMKL